MQSGLPLDFILSFCRERIPEHGEDCYCYSFCDTAGILGAFDGCGGAGARTHAAYSGKSEAYIASRLCAGAVYDSFRRAFPCELPQEQVLPLQVQELLILLRQLLLLQLHMSFRLQ